MMVKDVISGTVQVCNPETDLRSVAAMMVKHDCGATMTSRLITIRLDDDLEDAMQLMKEHQIRRLVVVDESDNLAGILSLGDVLQVTDWDQ